MSRAATLSRRDFARAGLVGLGSASVSGLLPALAAAGGSRPPRSCILLWMGGGPSQTDTLDPKPGHANGGPFRAIETTVPGLRLGEHLPQVARQAGKLAVVRSMRTREGDHGRATFHARTGNLPQGAIQFPVLGSLVAHERDAADRDLPGYVSVAPPGQFAPESASSGFLGPRFAPLAVGARDGGEAPRVQDLDPPPGVPTTRGRDRLALLADLDRAFLDARPGSAAAGQRAAYAQAVRLMRDDAAKAFRLEDEPAALRDRYGRNRFGQGCLLARRLVERGVPFVEVALGGWDTHEDNFAAVERLCRTLDPAWATLLADLEARGLLASTLVLWMGEFGRTPAINPRHGRDHFPNAWSVALAGAGVRGGQVVGRTSADGMTVDDRPATVPDLLATTFLALGLDPMKQNMSNVARPIRLADPTSKPIREVLA